MSSWWLLSPTTSFVGVSSAGSRRPKTGIKAARARCNVRWMLNSRWVTRSSRQTWWKRFHIYLYTIIYIYIYMYVYIYVYVYVYVYVYIYTIIYIMIYPHLPFLCLPLHPSSILMKWIRPGFLLALLATPLLADATVLVTGYVWVIGYS